MKWGQASRIVFIPILLEIMTPTVGLEYSGYTWVIRWDGEVSKQSFMSSGLPPEVSMAFPSSPPLPYYNLEMPTDLHIAKLRIHAQQD